MPLHDGRSLRRNEPSTFQRLLEFRDVLTRRYSDPPAPAYRVVLSSGGAAGARNTIVSEGMGYALLLAGLTLLSETSGQNNWKTA